MDTPLLSTGIPGLDHTLGGDLPANRLKLVQGDPGEGVRQADAGAGCPKRSGVDFAETDL